MLRRRASKEQGEIVVLISCGEARHTRLPPDCRRGLCGALYRQQKCSVPNPVRVSCLQVDPLGDLNTAAERALGALVKQKYGTDFYILHR